MQVKFPLNNDSSDLKLPTRLNVRNMRFENSWLDYEFVRKLLIIYPHRQLFEYIRLVSGEPNAQGG